MENNEMAMVQELAETMAGELTKHLSPEQAELYCKIYEADEETVFEGFGKTKDEIIEMFLVYAMQQSTKR